MSTDTDVWVVLVDGISPNHRIKQDISISEPSFSINETSLANAFAVVSLQQIQEIHWTTTHNTQHTQANEHMKTKHGTNETQATATATATTTATTDRRLSVSVCLCVMCAVCWFGHLGSTHQWPRGRLTAIRLKREVCLERRRVCAVLEAL